MLIKFMCLYDFKILSHTVKTYLTLRGSRMGQPQNAQTRPYTIYYILYGCQLKATIEPITYLKTIKLVCYLCERWLILSIFSWFGINS